MSLTRKLLRELRLDDPAVDRIIAAHVETVDALRAERDEALARAAEADRVQANFDAYRARIDADRLASRRQAVLRGALLESGANPHAVDLLAEALRLPDEAWDDAALKDPAAALAPVREQYAALFAQPVAIPTPPLNPPGGSPAPLTREDVGRMSEQEILANWGAVQSALKGAT